MSALHHLDLSRKENKMYLCELFGQIPPSAPREWSKYSSNNKNVDLIVGGCSYTAGTGVKYEDSWGEILGRALSMDYVNISKNGWSVSAIVEKIFDQINNHGKPKYISLLLPQLGRSYQPVDMVNVRSVSAEKKRGFVNIILGGGRDTIAPESVKYSKRPHLLDDILIIDALVYESLKALNSLIYYCKEADIVLVWGTWDSLSRNIYDLVLSDSYYDHIDMKSYVPIISYNKYTADSAMSNYCKNPEHYGLVNAGNDDGHHSGAHYHLHWAEGFRAELQKYLC